MVDSGDPLAECHCEDAEDNSEARDGEGDPHAKGLKNVTDVVSS